jgi:hypothetical protein
LLQDWFGVNYLTIWRGFITHLNYSDPFNRLFEDCKDLVFKDQAKISLTNENKKIRPQKDSETRWSSTALMLRKATKFKDVVALMRVKATKDQLPHIPNWDPEHWEFVEELNTLLEPSILCIKVYI